MTKLGRLFFVLRLKSLKIVFSILIVIKFSLVTIYDFPSIQIAWIFLLSHQKINFNKNLSNLL
jgi:hypothetical protein